MIPLLAAFTAGFTFATVSAVCQLGRLRRQLTKAGSVTSQAQARRAQQFNQFCPDCKLIVNPQWKRMESIDEDREFARLLKERRTA